MLAQKLSFIGLQLNGTKTKVLTTSASQEASYVQICGTMTVVAILRGEMTHKYLGRKFPRDLNCRTEVEIMRRTQMCMAQISSAQIDIVEQKRVFQITVEINSCNCFSDCDVWFGFTAADAKFFGTN